MIHVKNFEKFELPTDLIKIPGDPEFFRQQSWRFEKPEDAETLFIALTNILDGNPTVGPIRFMPGESGQPSFVTVLWCSEASGIRRELRKNIEVVKELEATTQDVLNELKRKRVLLEPDLEIKITG